MSDDWPIMKLFTLDGAQRRAALHRVLWRLHFWAGLIGAPIVVFAALTGLLYALSPQIEAWRHGALDRVAVGAAVQPLDAQVAAVRAAHPEAALRFVVPAHRPGDTTQVYLREPQAQQAHPAQHAQPAPASSAPASAARGGGGHEHGLPRGSIVYVNPYSAEVVGQLPEMARFKTWAGKLHASALQGQRWRWLLELGASWMLVLLATGLVLWWPRSQARGGPGWRALIPRRSQGRRAWRDWHASVALALSLVLTVVLVTGLTWSAQAGARFRAAQEALGQATPKPPASLRSGTDCPLPNEYVGQSPGGIAGRLGSGPALGPRPQVDTGCLTPAGGQPLSWQAVLERARREAPAVALQLTPPQDATGTWRIENFDRSQPQQRQVRVLDAYSGATLYASGWAQLPLLSKATAVGIPFHRGEFGVWNQVLLVLTALAAIFSAVSGLAMWWLRRPRGRLAVPPLAVADLRAAPRWLWPLAALLGWALPVLGWSLLVLLVLEALCGLCRRRPAATAA